MGRTYGVLGILKQGDNVLDEHVVLKAQQFDHLLCNPWLHHGEFDFAHINLVREGLSRSAKVIQGERPSVEVYLDVEGRRELHLADHERFLVLEAGVLGEVTGQRRWVEGG